MAGELEKICKLLDEGSGELQCAAAMVLGELKPKDAAVKKALTKALKSTNESLRLYAVEALAEIDPRGALPQLVPLLGSSERVRARASEAIVGIGADAVKPLREQLGKADASVRRGILEVLDRLPSVDATDTLFAGLLDKDLDVVRRSAQAYRQRIPSMSAGDRAKALKKILDFLKSPRVQKQKTPIASCLAVVADFHDASAVKAVLPHVGRTMPPAVRTAALQALGQLPLEGSAARTAVAKLLPLVSEKDFNGIVRPALEVLRKTPSSKEDFDRLLKLMKSTVQPVRHYALRGLGSIGSARASAPLLEALLGDDRSLSETAGAALRSNADFVPALVKALGKEKDQDHVWKVAHVLQTYKNVLDKGTVKKFLSTALDRLGRNKKGFVVYVELARVAAPETLRQALLKRGRDLLAKKKPEEAERHLRLLARDDLASPETDFALACAQLRLQRRDLASAGGDRGSALSLFSKLARGGFALVKTLQKEAKALNPDDLLYLGFALAERQGAERDAGAEILKFVAKKFGSKPAGKSAKQKLKTQGIG